MSYLFVIGLLVLLLFLIFLFPRRDFRQSYLLRSSPVLAEGEEIVFHGNIKAWTIANPAFGSYFKTSSSLSGDYVILTNHRFIGFRKTPSFTRSGYIVLFGAWFYKEQDKINWKDKKLWPSLAGIAADLPALSISALRRSEGRVILPTIQNPGYQLLLYALDEAVLQNWIAAIQGAENKE